MSTTTTTAIPAKTEPWARAAHYFELTRPKISLMVLVTVAASAYTARWGQPNLGLLLHALIGTTFFAVSATALNQWLERRTDGLMERTADRPLPSGRLSPTDVVLFGAATFVIGLAYMATFVNFAATFFAAATWLLYVWVYTPLKTKTVWNTAIGAVPGALPVLIGWTAVGGEFDLRAWSLLLVLFLWQFPHFMAIAWLYRKQYARAGMQMLSVVDPTGWRGAAQGVAAALAVLLASLVPAILEPSASIYLLTALLLGVGQLFFAIRFLQHRDDHTARNLLRASLVYLPILLFSLAHLPLM